MTEPRLIKRYARSRLYDTEAARYISLDELRGWLVNGLRFVVIDAETGDDITRVLVA
jgi:polyhydroxyalkanoate synthesis repressor PhaR